MDFGTLRVTYVGDERPVVKAATIVDRINAQTARNAAANDRLVERSKRQLAQVQTREAKRAADDFIRELERMRRAEQQGSRGGGAGGGFGNQLSAMTGGRFGLAGGGAAAGVGAIAVAFTAAAKAGVEYNMTVDRLTRSFESLLGSQQAAAAHLQELRAFAARTPFEFEDVAHASQRFQNMGLAAKEVVPTLTAVGNAVAAAGGGSDEINRVSLALAQMGAKGKVSAEELNQLADAGVGGLKILEQQTGKTKAELLKMAEAGQISADMFLQAFRAAYGAGNQMQRQMETLSGAASTLKDSGKELLGQAFQPMHDVLRDIAVELAKITSEGWNTERMLKAVGNAARDAINSGNSPWFDRWLMFQGYLAGGPAGAVGAASILGYNQQKGPQTWGEAPINIPEQFKYKPKISDADLLGNMKKLDEQARVEGERKAEEAMRKSRQEAERQAKTVDSLREHLRGLTLQNELFSASEVEQEIALMRAKVAAEDLSGSYRTQADAAANLIAVQMRHLDVKKKLKDLEEEEKKEDKQREEARSRILTLIGAQGEEQARVLELFKDPAVIDVLSVWEMRALNVVATMRDFKSILKSLGEDSLTPSKAPGIAEPVHPVLDLSNVKEDPWKTFKESWHESLEYMRQDGADIFSDMFMRMGEGWRSALGGLVMDFATALQQMASQAAASAVWGAILGAVGSAFGGVFGGGGGGGLGSSAGGSILGGIQSNGAIWERGYASGTLSAPPGLRWVGERGPELMPFRGGERVFTNAQSMRMASASKTVQLNVHFNGQDATPKSRQNLTQVAKQLTDLVQRNLERGD